MSCLSLEGDESSGERPMNRAQGPTRSPLTSISVGTPTCRNNRGQNPKLVDGQAFPGEGEQTDKPAENESATSPNQSE